MAERAIPWEDRDSIPKDAGSTRVTDDGQGNRTGDLVRARPHNFDNRHTSSEVEPFEGDPSPIEGILQVRWVPQTFFAPDGYLQYWIGVVAIEEDTIERLG